MRYRTRPPSSPIRATPISHPATTNGRLICNRSPFYYWSHRPPLLPSPPTFTSAKIVKHLCVCVCVYIEYIHYIDRVGRHTIARVCVHIYSLEREKRKKGGPAGGSSVSNRAIKNPPRLLMDRHYPARLSTLHVSLYSSLSCRSCQLRSSGFG